MAIDLLTPEEFAERMKIGRSTVFDWVRKGVLVPGIHFFKQGRILRFLWTDAVVASLMEATQRSDATENTVTIKNTKKASPGLNWDY